MRALIFSLPCVDHFIQTTTTLPDNAGVIGRRCRTTQAALDTIVSVFFFAVYRDSLLFYLKRLFSFILVFRFKMSDNDDKGKRSACSFTHVSTGLSPQKKVARCDSANSTSLATIDRDTAHDTALSSAEDFDSSSPVGSLPSFGSVLHDSLEAISTAAKCALGMLDTSLVELAKIELGSIQTQIKYFQELISNVDVEVGLINNTTAGYHDQSLATIAECHDPSLVTIDWGNASSTSGGDFSNDSGVSCFIFSNVECGGECFIFSNECIGE